MATFVYAPAIRVHVATEKNGILDISDDITEWEIIRRSNAPSTFNFSLQNTQRKYDGVFRPSDRITVELKRIVWVRVFTGSLNNVPIFSGWPRALPMSATCTLKKLQFWFWDPTTTAATNMVTDFFQTTGTISSSKGDSEMYKLVIKALTTVTNWDPQAIHIGAVPNGWFKWAQETELAISAAESMEAVLGPGTTSGAVGNLHLPAGNYGGSNLTTAMLDIAGQVFATTISQAGLTSVADQDRAALIALMVAGDESTFSNLDIAVDHTSLGVFQQQNNWGTAANRLNVQWATLAFLKGANGNPGLFAKKDWKTNPDPAMVCYSVQRSQISDGSNYRQWQATAQALVTKFRAQASSAVTAQTGSNPSRLDTTGSTPSGGTSYRGTGDAVAKVAYDMITTWPHLRYQTPPPASFSPRMDTPVALDCSGLTSWVYYHTTSTEWSGHDTYSQYPTCAVRDIPPEIAYYIRGCFLFGNFDSRGPGHTGIAIGDGKRHVAAHDASAPVGQQVNISDLPGGLTVGALAPGIDYTAAGTTDAAVKWLQKKLGKACTKSTLPLDKIADPGVSGGIGGTDTNANVFAQIVSAQSYTVTPQDMFGDKRAMINNHPFLPWVGNLTNSTMRAFCSAPNGDFMAWFPDYFNVWGTAAVMDVQLIELQDFTVEWSDQQIVTHEFVLGSLLPTFDGTSGAIVDGGGVIDGQPYAGYNAMMQTQGLVTMDFPQIFKAIYGKVAGGNFATEYIKRFGARPNLEQMPNIMHGPQEFYMALWQFMKHWSEQFNATIPLTFMPELWPGMILRIPELGFQAYVQEVNHRGSYGQGGQFTTEVKIIAPAPIDGKLRGSLFGVLDVFH